MYLPIQLFKNFNTMDEMIHNHCSGSCVKLGSALNTSPDNAENYIDCFREILKPIGVEVIWDVKNRKYFYLPQGKLTTVFIMTWEWADTKESLIIQQVTR
jgi:hypothetical protein